MDYETMSDALKLMVEWDATKEHPPTDSVIFIGLCVAAGVDDWVRILRNSSMPLASQGDALRFGFAFKMRQVIDGVRPISTESANLLEQAFREIGSGVLHLGICYYQ
ncbi:hypothetical protein CQX95_003429 [Salmonella enterica]|nr:hypothetical protein [Salmonella enterica]EFS2730218.1 hypothetical protein [Salmonella enterica]EHY8113143.1 hypothetical protein [Salmonella enterica]EIR5288643.1 hypothetical protein [Salmonella enterica]